MANILTNIFSSFNRRLAVDLGTTRTRIWLDGEGLLVDEPSLIAVDQSQGKVVAVGEKAAAMMGRVSQPIKIFRPIYQPKIQDDDLARAMLKMLLQQASRQAYFFNPSVLVSLPTSSPPVMKAVVVELLTELGAKEVLTIAQPLAAAIGAGVPIADASGCFILQLGGGVAEAAAISLGKVVQRVSSTQAGLEFDRELQYHLRQQTGVQIALRTAEQLKTDLACALAKTDKQLTVTGTNLSTDSPQEVVVNCSDLEEIVVQFVQKYQNLIKQLLSQVPPDLTTDVIDKGLLLSGGLAQLSGVCVYLAHHLDLPASVVDEPDLAVIRGMGVVLEHLDEFKQSLGYQVW